MSFSTYRLFDAAPPPPPAHLLWRDDMPAEMIAEHDWDKPMAAVDLVTIRDEVFGGMGLFREGDGISLGHGVSPDYLPGMIAQLGLEAKAVQGWVRGLLRDDARQVVAQTPVIVPVHPNWNFGHFLFEMMLRALVLDQACPPDWPVALADPGPHWLPDLLRLVVPRRAFLRYDPAHEVMTAPAFVGCTELVTRAGIMPGVLPLLALLKVRLLADAGTEPLPEKVFLSRGTNHRRRQVENREEIEAIAADLGYAVIQPETLPFARQMQIMDGARVVAGEFGSAMHNTLFCRAGTVVVCLNWINPYQSIVARSLDHVAGYIAPQSGAFRDSAAIWAGNRAMRFDPAEVRRKLAEAAGPL